MSRFPPNNAFGHVRPEASDSEDDSEYIRTLDAQQIMHIEGLNLGSNTAAAPTPPSQSRQRSTHTSHTNNRMSVIPELSFNAIGDGSSSTFIPDPQVAGAISYAEEERRLRRRMEREGQVRPSVPPPSNQPRTFTTTTSSTPQDTPGSSGQIEYWRRHPNAHPTNEEPMPPPLYEDHSKDHEFEGAVFRQPRRPEDVRSGTQARRTGRPPSMYSYPVPPQQSTHDFQPTLPSIPQPAPPVAAHSSAGLNAATSEGQTRSRSRNPFSISGLKGKAKDDNMSMGATDLQKAMSKQARQEKTAKVVKPIKSLFSGSKQDLAAGAGSSQQPPLTASTMPSQPRPSLLHQRRTLSPQRTPRQPSRGPFSLNTRRTAPVAGTARNSSPNPMGRGGSSRPGLAGPATDFYGPQGYDNQMRRGQELFESARPSRPRTRGENQPRSSSKSSTRSDSEREPKVHKDYY